MSFFDPVSFAIGAGAGLGVGSGIFLLKDRLPGANGSEDEGEEAGGARGARRRLEGGPGHARAGDVAFGRGPANGGLERLAGHPSAGAANDARREDARRAAC